ncbi:long-chain-fatty-acid--CoA ligase [Bordetella petrii]|nr:long-chain-fatty-acid--CoA ligase [Bordetella petrii]
MTTLGSTPATTGPAYQLLIKNLLVTPLATTPDQEIVYRDRRFTYRTMRQRIGQLAAGLARHGIQHGDVVAVLDWDTNRYFEALFAVPMMGATLQTVNVRLSPQQIQYTMEHAEPRILLVNREFVDMVAAMRAALPSVSEVIVMDDADDGADPQGYEAMLAPHDGNYVFPDFDENTRATLFYTSGTTGMPKGVYYTHRQLVLHTLASAAALGTPSTQGRFHRGDVYMPITPMFHVHAWGLPYIATMMGVKQVYPGRYTPEGLLSLRRTEGVTFSHCVPTILRMLLGEADKTQADLRGWKLLIGGSAFPSALARQALARGMDVMGAYGMSETCPIVSLSQLDESLLDLDTDSSLPSRITAGRPIPLVDMRVVDSDMNTIAPGSGKAGEVVLHTPWLTTGYLHNEEASRELWRGGFLHTGDIGTICELGYMRVTDRMKDIIKTGGEWISSYLLEDLISRHPGVQEAAVIGVPDERWGERPMAIVVATASARSTLDAVAIQQHLQTYADSGAIPKYGIPTEVRFVDALPRTSVGKFDKKVMRRDFLPASGTLT